MTTIVDITQLNGGTFGVVKGTDVYPGVDVTNLIQSSTGTTMPYQIVSLLNFILNALGVASYQPVMAASTVNLTSTYNNGISGVGATLTNSGAQIAFSLDGQVGVQYARYLIKNQTSAFQNGIYQLTVVGDGVTNWVLTRVVDFNSSINIINNTTVFVLYGVINTNTLWQLTFSGGIIVGTTALNFAPYVV